MYVHEYRDRHGKVRRYFRRPGFPPAALPGLPGSPEFMEAYRLASVGFEVPKPIKPTASLPGSVSAAIVAYYGSAAYRGMADETQAMRRRILERFRVDHGDKRIARMKRAHVAAILARKKPFAVRNWLKTLRGLMAFAVEAGLLREDPTAGIRPARARAGTRHTWTEEEIAQYEARHPIGTRPRLAMALMLYTAARRADAVRLGPQHIRGGVLSYRQQKTGVVVEMQVHSVLAAALAATPSGHLTFLVTAAGKPFKAAAFGNLFRRWCDEAGLPQCSAHGLRKAQARRLAEAGCSPHMIASITGHKTLGEVARYTEAADRARLARAAIERLERGRNG